MSCENDRVVLNIDASSPNGNFSLIGKYDWGLVDRLWHALQSTKVTRMPAGCRVNE
jgi:hypothetical protein